MNEMQVRLSAGAAPAGTPTGPNAGRREPVREEKRGEDKRGKGTKKSENPKTPDCTFCTCM